MTLILHGGSEMGGPRTWTHKTSTILAEMCYDLDNGSISLLAMVSDLGDRSNLPVLDPQKLHIARRW